MAVYVDKAQHAFGRMVMCHMMADTEAELHAMAARIGVARRWYQGWAKASSPHYDICKSKRALALQHGAIEIDNRRMVEIMRTHRANRGQWSDR